MLLVLHLNIKNDIRQALVWARGGEISGEFPCDSYSFEPVGFFSALSFLNSKRHEGL